MIIFIQTYHLNKHFKRGIQNTNRNGISFFLELETYILLKS